MKKIIIASTLFVAFGLQAQDLNTEITVSHEVVPEEQAATRMRQYPAITLPKINAGRLSAASNYMPASLTPYINPLSAVQYADTMVSTPWKGYAALAYGPVYNLGASAGYRFIQQNNFIVNGYMQFDGMSYISKYPGIDYDGKVHFYRNTVLTGGDVTYKLGVHNITGALLYQYSHYNFPILNLQDLSTDKNFVNANVVKGNVGWNASFGKTDVRASADYGMIYFGKEMANNNRIAVKTGVAHHASTKSTWALDFNFSIDRSAIVGNKNLFEIHPSYTYANNKFKLRFGIDVDIPRCDDENAIKLRVIPELMLDWKPLKYFNVWLNSTWDMVDNNRLALYDEQPYLLPQYDASAVSGIWKMQIGIGLGPFRGASLRVYMTPTIAEDWYVPGFGTGYLTTWLPNDSYVLFHNHIGGVLFGASFNYDYRQYLSMNVTGEYVSRPSSTYTRGYAPWRDHANFNLMAQATVRPINKLDITISYQLRTGREKMIGDIFARKSLNLRNISNLQLGIGYKITNQWSAFLRGENLLNKHWYLGPAVPTQGIMGMIGATYKF